MLNRTFPPMLQTSRGGRIAAGVAIFIGVAFATATLLVGAGFERSITETVAAQAVRSDLVVVARPGQELPGGKVKEIEGLPGVKALFVLREETREIGWPIAGDRLTRLQTIAGQSELRWQQLAGGRWPENAHEVVVDSASAGKFGVDLGQTITGSAKLKATVVGTVQLPGSVGSALPTVFVPSESAGRWISAGAKEVHVKATSSDSVNELWSRLSSVAGQGVVRTGAEHARVLVSELSGDTVALQGALLAFAAVALFVASLVIGNTFSVVFAQHSRRLALLRCVGATRGQVFRAVMGEAAFFGFVVSLLGVAAGIGAGVLLTMPEVTLPPYAILVPLCVGVLMTLTAAYHPARTTTRIKPVEALRTTATRETAATGFLWLASGTGLALTGFAALSFGAYMGSYPFGVLGGVLSMGGVLLLARPLLPALIRGLRAPFAALFRESGLIAGDNAARNPRRAAVTSVPIFVGMTLIATLLVAVNTAEETLSRQIISSYPVDIEITANGAPLKPQVIQEMAKVSGIEKVASLRGARVKIGGEPRVLLGADESVAEVSHGEVSPRPGEILVPPPIARNTKTAMGGTIEVPTPNGSLRLIAKPTQAEVSALIVTSEDLARIAPEAPFTAQWMSVTQATRSADLVEDVRRASADQPDIVLNGAVQARAGYQDLLDNALLVALGLLAFSSLIAMVGIANTLTLSVLERTRESGLLRALGLTRRQLRRSLTLEAVMMALAASIPALLLGCVYGIAGTYSVLELGGDTVPSIPVGQLALVVLGAVAITALASLIPARRAARIPPATALMDE
ncbi:ABC transporter permease [Microbispora sp. NPDC049633]|uniref:ABC transporter permease n=1 Tax=Microbispora sp. NPDC049633 TaxID=3154355 RepID=UPI003416AF63